MPCRIRPHSACATTAATSPGCWKTPWRAPTSRISGAARAAAGRGRLRGIGLAQYCERVAGAWAENAWVELDATGQVRLLVGTMSNGQGHETAYAQLVADALGLAPEAIAVIQGDTDRIPSGRGTGGSASLSIGGAAASAAAADLVRQALPLAAEALEAAAADVAFEDGAFRIAGTDRAIGLADVARGWAGTARRRC